MAHAKRDYELSSADYDFWNVRAPVMSAVRSAALTWVGLCCPAVLPCQHQSLRDSLIKVEVLLMPVASALWLVGRMSGFQFQSI